MLIITGRSYVSYSTIISISYLWTPTKHDLVPGAAAEFVTVQHLVQPRAGQAARPQGRRRPEREGRAVPGEDQAVPGQSQ